MCTARAHSTHHVHVHGMCTACAWHVHGTCTARVHLLDVALQQLYSLAGAKVPQPDETVEAGRGDERPVRMESDAVERARVPLLQQVRGRVGVRGWGQG